MKAIDLLQRAIERANGSTNFKKNHLVASLELNPLNNEVAIYLNGKPVLVVKAKNMTEAYLDIESWLVIASMSIYKDVSLHVTDGELKAIPK